MKVVPSLDSVNLVNVMDFTLKNRSEIVNVLKTMDVIKEEISDKTLSEYEKVMNSLSNLASQKDLSSLKSILDKERNSFLTNVRDEKKSAVAISTLTSLIVGITQGVTQLSKLSNAAGLNGESTSVLSGTMLANIVSKSYEQSKNKFGDVGGTPDDVLNDISSEIEKNPNVDIVKIIDGTKSTAPEYRKRLDVAIDTLKQLKTTFLQSISPKKENLGMFKTLYQIAKNAATGNVMKGLDKETFNSLFNQLLLTTESDREDLRNGLLGSLKGMELLSKKYVPTPTQQKQQPAETQQTKQNADQIVSKTSEDLKIGQDEVMNVVNTIKSYIQTTSKGGTKITGDAAIAGLADAILRSIKK